MQNRFDLVQFEHLQEAVIDASSIIYMTKTSFLEEVQEVIHLYTLPEILDEVGLEYLNISLMESPQHEMPNDHKLLACALEQNWPLISEDKALLMRAKRTGLVYYNALMMLNFLLCKGRIDEMQYQQYYAELRRVARYSQRIWEIGENVYQRIIRKNSGEYGSVTK